MAASKTKVPHFDSSDFSNEGYTRLVKKPWGEELHFVPPDAPYMGKLLRIKAGCRLSLQLHDKKRESWILMSGKAAVIWDNNKGKLVKTVLKPKTGYSLEIGQRHRLVGITDCELVEVSTPEMGTTWRLEDDYARPDETPRQRAIERGEA